MFRQDLLVASLFRNFLLAKRIMKTFNCTPQSWPVLADSTTHNLWLSWDLTLESFIHYSVAQQKGSALVDAKNNMSFAASMNLSFFTDQLAAFEVCMLPLVTVMCSACVVHVQCMCSTALPSRHYCWLLL